jgi:hypothetical protein
MYVKGSQASRIDAILCTGGTFQLSGDSLPAALEAELHMAYVDSSEGLILGGYELSSLNFSPATMVALHKFIELAEADFGATLFGSGSLVRETESDQTQSNTGMAESNRGV